MNTTQNFGNLTNNPNRKENKLSKMKQKYTDPEDIKFIYDANLQRVFNKKIPVHIFGTGSAGNSFFFKQLNLLIDMGLPMKRYTEWDEDFFDHVDHIIITHEHGDHFNPSTFIKALNEYPHITAWMTKTMYQEITKSTFKAQYKRSKDADGKDLTDIDEITGKEYKGNEIDAYGNKVIEKSPFKEKLTKLSGRIELINDENPTDYAITTRNRNLTLHPYIVKHGDIINLAIGLTDNKTGAKLLYVSDIDNLYGQTAFKDKNNVIKHASGVPQNEKFDVLYLEANHDEQILADWMALHQDDTGALARARSSLRHLSEAEAMNYVKNHITTNGLFIPIHGSSTFGTMVQ